MKIPCTCICTVFNHNHIEDNLFKEHNLEPRWRLCNHPLYNQAINDLGITAPNVIAQPQGGQSIFTFDKQLYDSIKYPKTEDIRFSKVKEIFSQTAKLAVQNQAKFKQMVIWLTAMHKHFNNSSVELGVSVMRPSMTQLLERPILSQVQDEGMHLPTVLQELDHNSTCILPPRLPDSRKRGRVGQIKNLSKHLSQNDRKKRARSTQ